MFYCKDPMSIFINVVPNARFLVYSLLIVHTFHNQVMTFPYRSNYELIKTSEGLEKHLYSKHLPINLASYDTTTKNIFTSINYKSESRTKEQQNDCNMIGRSREVNHETDNFRPYHDGNLDIKIMSINWCKFLSTGK